ncbi:MAG: hypothetical protein HN704_10640 [Bacteroidetes bacterium]|jgi:hypothetical protein|nr:hypothetical protein [Bacteroidota bacterium]MBT6685196.1 hypothetical protein [Bacteroidota bacterium]MBT7143453.1 hypothetical protein [Bacteroidota bacterium]MBT7492049.1 hypothetical protein [Bacteroidota bacterium]
MKQKVFIGALLIIIVVAISLMVKDFVDTKNTSKKNPYKYDLESLKKIDSTKFCFKEIHQLELEISEPKCIAVDNQSNIFVGGQDEISVFDKFGKFTYALKASSAVNCMAISSFDELYVGTKNSIQLWNHERKLEKSWLIKADNVLITSLAIKDSSIFVADAGNGIVWHYNINGELLNRIGDKDTVQGIFGFVIPSSYFDLKIGRDGELWVVNPGRHSLEAYTDEGNLISSWTKSSMQIQGFCGCCNPSNIAILSNGSFVTSEKGIERVKVYKPSGEFDCVVAGPDSFEKGTKGIDLAVDSDDRIVVLDPLKKVVRIFVKL